MQLIWGSDGRAVRDVFVAAKQIVRNGQLTGVDLETLKTEAAKAQKALLRRLSRAGG